MTTEKTQTVGEDMEARRLFDSTEAASTYLAKAAESYDDFDDVPFIGVGIDSDEDGNATFDENVYPGETRVMVAVLKNRGEIGKDGKRQASTVRAIVVVPAPTVDQIMTHSDEGADWVQKIIDKELNHVAVRALRTADDVYAVSDQVPTSIEDYITSQRVSGGAMEAFNTLYKKIGAILAAKSPIWNRAKINKSDLRLAMSNAAFAAREYPALEDRGDKPSLFVLACQMGAAASKAEGLDPAIFEQWLANRDKKTIEESEDEDEDLDLEDLTAELFGGEDKDEETEDESESEDEEAAS